MALFQFRAVAPNGAVVQGEIEALDRARAAARLQEQGHVPLKVDASIPKTGVRGFLARDMGGTRRPGSRLVSDLLARLSLLLDAGLVLEAALGLLAASEGVELARSEAAALLKKLRSGSSLADAMVSRGKTFPPVVVAMVRAGETSGTLSLTTKRLSDHLVRAQAVRQSVRSAMVYPGVLLATALGSVLLVMLVVLPELEPIFADSGAALPLLTKLAFWASDGLRQNWWAIILVVIASGFVSHRAFADPRLQARRDAAFLSLPVVGLTLRRAETARFSRVLGTLLGGGVGLAQALVLAQPVLANLVLRDAVAGVVKAVREGGGLAAPLARTNAFPDLAVQLIRIGEATGHLDKMLIRLADILEADVQHTLDRALALLVPVITILLGAFVAGIISSVMLAMLGVNEMVH